jgi:diaminohydroxyphosphoribosylaminopyrimidine deaminase / 5-amino-6-(5-phosphoribosylamino)uracil reductase
MADRAFDEATMRRALALASKGRGFVEPNPQVGAVVARDGRIVGEGWHERFGGPHAELMALAAAGDAARGGTLSVTLEPCCHHGKTPPCTDAILAAGIARVVVAAEDPFPAVAGRGIEMLRAAGVVVDVGLCRDAATRLTAPFRTLVTAGRPWVIAKWAMSVDGYLAAAPEADRWISSPESRAVVHDLRTRVDAIVVGIGTALADDPSLTARPVDPASAGPRRPLRIVLDRRARLPLDSRLVRTARETPVLVAVDPDAPADRIVALEAAGCEVWRSRAPDQAARFAELLTELGRRRCTNVLVEGGPTVLASGFAAGLIDEVWTFVAPKVLAAQGRAPAPDVPPFDVEEVTHPGGDILTKGVVRRA